jgi:hypothetical protein
MGKYNRITGQIQQDVLYDGAVALWQYDSNITWLNGQAYHYLNATLVGPFTSGGFFFHN